MQQAVHPMLPVANHDEAARQDFVFSLRQEVVFHAKTGSRKVFETRVEPAFRKQMGRAPQPGTMYAPRCSATNTDSLSARFAEPPRNSCGTRSAKASSVSSRD